MTLGLAISNEAEPGVRFIHEGRSMDVSYGAGDWPTALRHVWHIRDGESRQREIETVLEEPLSLHINGERVAILMRLPGMEKELAAGFCVSEGLVGSFSDILIVHHCGQGLPSPGSETSEEEGESRNRVEVTIRPGALQADARLDMVRLIRAGCGAVDVDRADLALEPVKDGTMVDLGTISGLGSAMRAGQRLHQRVGGVHGAALFDAGGGLVVVCEDVGRHNAVDKALGYCLLRGISLRGKLLLCSGRLTYEMVTKTIHLGIPLLASISAPTTLAVQLAERFNVTLIGYLRGHRMTIYSHPERIRKPCPGA